MRDRREQAAGGLVGYQQCADGQAVREPLRERDELGLDPELLVGEERAGATQAALDLVVEEQAAVPAGRSAAVSRKAGVAGWIPPSPWTGSRRTQATLPSAPVAASDSPSFRRAKRTSGTSGSNAVRLAG